MPLARSLSRLAGGNLRLTSLHGNEAVIRAYGLFRKGMSKVGLQVVAKTFYSPIPDLDRLPAETWTRRSDLAGIDFDLDRQLAFLEELAPYVAEFDPPSEPATDPHAYHRDNPSYGIGDADVLYAVVRHGRPSRIVELGSGFTTLVAAQALQANRADGAGGELHVYDPFAGVAGPDTPGVTSFEAVRAQDVPLEGFDGLAAGDILLVDTTHTVKVGGDVNRIVLDIVPRLAPGVLVHFHDIFLPYEYPREWPERYGLFWAEQYLLQAFLSLNAEFEVVLALFALLRERTARLRAVVPALETGGAPAAFWIRRKA